MAKKRSAPAATGKRRSKANGGGGGEGSSSGRVHLYVGISLDGYIADAKGGVDWLNPYADARAGFTPFAKSIGSAIMGRGTYDHAVAGGYADFGMPAYVITHRPFTPASASVVPYSGDLKRLVETMRAEHPRDIWLIGGGEVAKAFHEQDLIDIWTIGFIPTLLGKGLPMFPPVTMAERRLRLVRTHTYKSGVIELRYERLNRAD